MSLLEGLCLNGLLLSIETKGRFGYAGKCNARESGGEIAKNDP
jgi:hypothetical protein